MDFSFLTQLKEAMVLTCLVSAPVLLAALSTGLVISFFQAVTQIQDQSLSFVPKVLAVFLALTLAASWMIQSICEFARHIFANFPVLLG